MHGRRRKLPPDWQSDVEANKRSADTQANRQRQGSLANPSSETQRPFKTDVAMPNPKRPGADSPITPNKTRSNGAQLDNFGGHARPAQFCRRDSRNFDQGDKHDNKEALLTPDTHNHRTRTVNGRENSTAIRDNSSPRAFLRSSTSYTDPLPLLAETANSRAHQAAPLTEANLRYLLRTLDKKEDEERDGSGSGSGRRVEPQPSTLQQAQARRGRVSPHHTRSVRPSDGPWPSVSVSASTAPPASAVAKELDSVGAKFEPSSPMRKSKSPKKQDKDRDRKKSSKRHDPDTHPLNLPPDQLRKLTARMAREEAERQSMSVDREVPETDNKETSMPTPNGSSQPATPSHDTPGAFPEEPATNGINGHTKEERSPTPPPHKVPPAPKVDPEACKAAGNKFFKAKDYDRAIIEYSKGLYHTVRLLLVWILRLTNSRSR